MKSPVDSAKESPAVICRGVTRTYGSGNAAVQALRGVDLEIRKGELLMLAGPSGCGKTTLISILAGLLQRDGGSCATLERDFKDMPPGEATRFRGRNIGFVFQSFNLIPALTAAENVATTLIINGSARRPALARAEALLREVGFDPGRIRSLPAELSGGQQQRVAVARAMIHNPGMIFCDEPTSALDSGSGHQVMKALRTSALGKNRTVLVVTHDSRIFEFADRIAWMEDGRITRIESQPDIDRRNPQKPHDP